MLMPLPPFFLPSSPWLTPFLRESGLTLLERRFLSFRSSLLSVSRHIRFPVAPGGPHSLSALCAMDSHDLLYRCIPSQSPRSGGPSGLPSSFPPPPASGGESRFPFTRPLRLPPPTLSLNLPVPCRTVSSQLVLIVFLGRFFFPALRRHLVQILFSGAFVRPRLSGDPQYKRSAEFARVFSGRCLATQALVPPSTSTPAAFASARAFKFRSHQIPPRHSTPFFTPFPPSDFALPFRLNFF